MKLYRCTDPNEALEDLLADVQVPWPAGTRVGIKLHWGERGNHSYLPPVYARSIARWLRTHSMQPFVCDTTVLYSGGRRTGRDSLETAFSHGYTPEFLECPVVIADGLDGRDVTEIAAGYPHFEQVEVAASCGQDLGFVIFSHFKGHLASGFGGAVKNISMGFASRAQKQRMHANVKPILRRAQCTRCGVCVEVCPVGAAAIEADNYPLYDLERCIGCGQCIAQCPEMALKILWNEDSGVFQEKLVETAAALWRQIGPRSVLINALLNITRDCDCLPGKAEFLTADLGFMPGNHPLTLDQDCLQLIGAEIFQQAHPHVPWPRQFEHARKIGFVP